MSNSRRCILIFLFLTIALAFAYVVKVKLHINLSKSYSLSEHFPLVAKIEPAAIENTMVGSLVMDTFEPTLIGSLDWANLWSREPDRVDKSLVKDESHGSHCLLINSSTDLDWSVRRILPLSRHSGAIISTQGRCAL